MYRKPGQVTTLLTLLLTLRAGAASACLEVGEPRYPVLIEHNDFSATGLYDSSRRELYSVPHVIQALNANAEPACFLVRNVSGSIQGRFRIDAGKTQLDLPVGFPSHRPTHCLGFSQFQIQDPSVRMLISRTMKAIYGRLEKLSRLEPDPHWQKMHVDRQLGDFVRLAVNAPADGFFLQEQIAYLKQQTSPLKNSDFTPNTIHFPIDASTFFILSPIGAYTFDETSLVTDCDSWQGASGSLVLDDRQCIVGFVDALADSPAKWFRGLASVGHTRHIFRANGRKIRPC